jgi:hypothetical protein
VDEGFDSDDKKMPIGQVPTATMDEAGVITCTCGRTYSIRKNYIRCEKLTSDQSAIFLYSIDLSFKSQAHYV